MILGATSHSGCKAASLTPRSAYQRQTQATRSSHTRLRRSFTATASQFLRSQHKVCKARAATLQVFSGAIQQVSQEELEQELADRKIPLIIDFYATWCGPCVLLAKELEQVADDLGDKVKILKIDTDQNPELSTQLQIQGLPTMVFIGMDPKKPALRTEGLLPAATIKQIVEDELSPTASAAASTQ